LKIIQLGHVGLNTNGLAAQFADFFDQLFGAFGMGAVIDHHFRAQAANRFNDRLADSGIAAGDNDHFVAKTK
jgi:hypothetical protein